MLSADTSLYKYSGERVKAGELCVGDELCGENGPIEVLSIVRSGGRVSTVTNGGRSAQLASTCPFVMYDTHLNRQRIASVHSLDSLSARFVPAVGYMTFSVQDTLPPTVDAYHLGALIASTEENMPPSSTAAHVCTLSYYYSACEAGRLPERARFMSYSNAVRMIMGAIDSCRSGTSPWGFFLSSNLLYQDIVNLCNVHGIVYHTREVCIEINENADSSPNAAYPEDERTTYYSILLDNPHTGDRATPFYAISKPCTVTDTTTEHDMPLVSITVSSIDTSENILLDNGWIVVAPAIE